MGGVSSAEPMRIAIVAGESSGDQLAAGLIHALRERRPRLHFEGVAGPRMQEAGCETIAPMEHLSVMGLVEVLRHLPELLSLRRALVRRYLEDPPELFIGVDAPDFNLGLEAALRRAGIPVVHYVSPSVWAWRQGRVRRIAGAVDRMLTLFPFEADFYRRHGVDVRFVGHPFADAIPLRADRAAAREALDIPGGGEVVALLPGSRRGEVGRLAAPFLETARRLAARRPGLRFLVPLASRPVGHIFERELQRVGGELPVQTVQGRVREVLAACDVVLAASGTVTLEALLFKRPMAVAYRLSPPTYLLLKGLRMIKVDHVSLPNLLADSPLVKEFLQADVQPAAMAAELERLLELPEEERREWLAACDAIHRSLRKDADRRAADAVLELIDGERR